ncbi:hypothetical protein [Syntrophomonas palmitatica]|uniref:hypothetical protein n=1 Tax=Syntrophomonas palmitatica TaxID=402877 RepID=UPI0006D284BC|nr:hypothetical protein [Syntrophomonas palmitatica]
MDRIVSRRELRKVVIVGEMDDMGAFAARICDYGIPVSIHSLHPARYEVLSYRLMYEKGCAVSTSYLEPHNWGRGDLVLIFDEAGARLSIQAPEAFCLCLNDSSKGWSPEIENNLARNGIDTALHNLAPIVETCLLAPEEGAVPDNEALKFTCLQERGQAMGLWDVFLEAPGVGSAAPSLS